MSTANLKVGEGVAGAEGMSPSMDEHEDFLLSEMLGEDGCEGSGTEGVISVLEST